MKIVVGLLLDRYIGTEDEITKSVTEISSYINHIEKLYIYNQTTADLFDFLNRIKRYSNIEYTNMKDLGEVYNYQIILDKAVEDNADFAIILKIGYFYEEDAFLNIKRYLLSNSYSDLAIATPLPLYGNQTHLRKSENTRYVKGCKFIGAFINIQIYKELGLDDIYYQTTFDYDYCIRARLKKKEILLFNNDVLRNNNYSMVDKRWLFTTLSTYDIDIMDLYYETRNRYYLWNKYKNLDSGYIKIDKKLARGEKHELRFRDRGYREKLAFMAQAKIDYKKNRMGKYQNY